MSWKAPFGQPRASDTLSVACGDSTARDTLFLTYVTGRTSRFFVGLEATVYVRAQEGDTLPPFWQLDGAGSNSVRVEFSTDSPPGSVRPLKGQGFSGSFHDRTTGSGRLRLVQVVPYSQLEPVQDSTQYFLARMIFSRPSDASLCARPICLEFAAAEFALDSTFTTMSGRAGSRFASWNSPKGRVCDPFRPQGPAPWRPKAPGSN
jgi:hypothetical protein